MKGWRWNSRSVLHGPLQRPQVKFLKDNKEWYISLSHLTLYTICYTSLRTFCYNHPPWGRKTEKYLTWNSGNLGVLFFRNGSDGASKICNMKKKCIPDWQKGNRNLWITDYYRIEVPTFLFNGRALNLRVVVVSLSSSILLFNLTSKQLTTPMNSLGPRSF